MATLTVHPLGHSDRPEWKRLARGYKDFYEDPVADEVYDEVWTRLTADGPVHGLGCRSDGALVGIAHFLFHAHSWQGEVCYLQDLFTLPEARGQGVARALIDAAAADARERDCAAFYWLTKADNEVACALYDKVARNKGFIRYDYPL
jgi:ribosomal protein S18 acetylase RimI-like enzyme